MPGGFAALGTSSLPSIRCAVSELGDAAADALLVSLAATPEPQETTAETAGVSERGPGDALN